MSEKEIVIPISKIRTKSNSDLPKEMLVSAKKDTDSNEDTAESSNIQVDNDGKITIKFSKFLQLLASHDFDEITNKHKEESLVISSDLLVDLADNSGYDDSDSESKFSLIVLGILLGLIISSIIFLLLLK